MGALLGKPGGAPLLGGPEGYEMKAIGMGNEQHPSVDSGNLEWAPLLGTSEDG
jgi:hypothetical protein